MKVALVTAASKGIGAAIVHAALASDDMSYVTGQCLLVDGGMIRGT